MNINSICQWKEGRNGMSRKERNILITTGTILGIMILLFVSFVFWQKKNKTEYLISGKERQWKENEAEYKEAEDYEAVDLDDYTYSGQDDLVNSDSKNDKNNTENSSTQKSENITNDISNETENKARKAVQKNKTVKKNNRGYVIPYSSSRKLKKSDLKPLSKDQLSKARNEIYARHGRRFIDSSLQKYFNAKSWYKPKYSPEKFDRKSKKLLSALERRNVLFIQQYEKKK